MNKNAHTYWVYIYIGGDINVIRDKCRKYCMVGLCVTVEPLEFIYTGGSETGARIGLLNYPRFPNSDEVIKNHAIDLANQILLDACQQSFLIIDSKDTQWFSCRKEDQL